MINNVKVNAFSNFNLVSLGIDPWFDVVNVNFLIGDLDLQFYVVVSERFVGLVDLRGQVLMLQLGELSEHLVVFLRFLGDLSCVHAHFHLLLECKGQVLDFLKLAVEPVVDLLDVLFDEDFEVGKLVIHFFEVRFLTGLIEV